MISISTIYMIIAIFFASVFLAAIASSDDEGSFSGEKSLKDFIVTFLVCFFSLSLWPITLTIFICFLLFETYKKYVEKKCRRIFHSNCLHYYNLLDERNREIVDKIKSHKDLEYILYASKFDFLQITDKTKEYIKNRIINISFEKTVLED